MSGSNESALILNAETRDQLLKARDTEINNILKLRLVLQELRHLPVASMNLPDETQLERAVKVLNIGEYLTLNGKDNDCLLGLNDVRNINLTYTERRAVRHHLVTNIQKNLKPIADFGRRMRTELPHIFVGVSPDNSAAAQSDVASILALERQRRQNIEKLIEVRNRKCAYLKAAAELKTGPYLGHELELLHTQAQLNHVKASVLRGFFINELVTRTDHSLKAIKEVDGYITKSLEETE